MRSSSWSRLRVFGRGRLLGLGSWLGLGVSLLDRLRLLELWDFVLLLLASFGSSSALLGHRFRLFLLRKTLGEASLHARDDLRLGLLPGDLLLRFAPSGFLR